MGKQRRSTRRKVRCGTDTQIMITGYIHKNTTLLDKKGKVKIMINPTTSRVVTQVFKNGIKNLAKATKLTTPAFDAKLVKALEPKESVIASALRAVANAKVEDVCEISKAIKVLPGLPDTTMTFTTGQAKLLRMLGRSDLETPILDAFVKLGGKKGVITISKEASKYHEGASVIRATLARGKKPIAKIAGVLGNNSGVATAKIGWSAPGVFGYGNIDATKLGVDVLDDLALSVSKKGGIMKFAANIGDAAKTAGSINPSELCQFANKIDPNASAKLGKLKSNIGEACDFVKKTFSGINPDVKPI